MRLSEVIVMTLFFAAVIFAGAIFGGCAMSVDHNISVKLDDDCLTRFPECAGDSFYCVNADGERKAACEVGCLAGRDLYCDAAGPYCTQAVGDDNPFVPVLCLTRE